MRQLMSFDESAPIVSVQDLVVEYRSSSGWGKFRALDDVSLSVHEGQTVSVVGESGSGKSTLGKVVLGLLRPTYGQAMFRGVPIGQLTFEQTRRYRREVQVVFQDPGTSLNPRKNVRSIIGQGLLIQKLATRAEVTDIVIGLLERVGLTPARSYLERMPAQLSGGQRQRVAIARAVAMRPKLIVADEALSALDVSVQAQVLQLLRSLHDDLKISYLFVSHDLDTVRVFSDEVVVMQSGRIVESADPETLFSHPTQDYTKRLLAARLAYLPTAG